MAKNKAKEVIQTDIINKTISYHIGDNVLVRGAGNKKSNGTGWEVVEEGKTIRRISNIYEGMNFPYEIGDPYGSVIGYFKEDAIQKLADY